MLLFGALRRSKYYKGTWVSKGSGGVESVRWHWLSQPPLGIYSLPSPGGVSWFHIFPTADPLTSFLTGSHGLVLQVATQGHPMEFSPTNSGRSHGVKKENGWKKWLFLTKCFGWSWCNHDVSTKFLGPSGKKEFGSAPWPCEGIQH
jgi:hypothetical protein